MTLSRLAAIVESSDDAIISKDLNSIVTTWNKGAEKIFGYSADEMIGTSIMRLIPADRQGEENHILGKIKCGESVENFETLRKTKDGQLIDVSVTASPIKDANGRIIGVSKVARDIIERKRVENGLQEAMRFAQSTIDALSAHVCVLDETGMILATNEAWQRFAKANPPIGPAQTGDNYLKVCDAAATSGDGDANSFAAGIRAVTRGERVEFVMEYACHSPSEKRWFVGLVTRFPGDSPVRVVVAHENITDRKLAEEARRTGEARYRTLFDYAPDGIVIVDAKGYYLDVNPSICRMLGYTRDEFIGLNATDIVAPAEIPHIGQALDVIKTKSDYQREWLFRRKDGSVFAVDTIATAMPGGNLLAMIRDITERKKTEEELIWKTAFLEAQVDSALDAILVVNDRAKVILQNQRLSQLFKIPDDIARDHDDNKMLQYVTNQMKNPNQFVERVTHLYAHPDEIGRDEIELVSGAVLDRYSAPVRDKSGKYYGRIWTFRDITEQRKLEAQFRQAQKMESIGQLAGGVAHDFNNILAVIQMQSDLLKSSGGLSADQSEFADEISITVQRAAALTRQLLLFSRREVFQPRDLDLSESVINTTKMLSRILGENIQVQLKLASQPVFIHADAGMMDQVLLNLALNARDAMPNGGQLVIETSGVEFDEFAVAQSPQARLGSFVRLNVSDSGCGIRPEILPKIFEPFFTTKDVGKGTRLGLATVFGIVQQHQGWINVDSEVNHGTTFRVIFHGWPEM